MDSIGPNKTPCTPKYFADLLVDKFRGGKIFNAMGVTLLGLAESEELGPVWGIVAVSKKSKIKGKRRPLEEFPRSEWIFYVVARWRVRFDLVCFVHQGLVFPL